MKTLIISLFISVAGASTLRGAVNEASKELPMPDSSCFRKSNTADVCETRASSDGKSKCVWCQTKEDGGGGVCLSNGDARNAVELMGVPCTNYYADAVAVMGTKPPDFNCFHAAWNGDDARATCDGSSAADDSPCVWCPMAEGGGAASAGACLSNEEAILADGKFGIACPRHIYLKPAEAEVKRGLPDVNCFKAAWVADNAESACGESSDKDGASCVWCQTDGDAMGACLSKFEAGMADGKLGLKCPNGDAAALEETL